MKNSYKIGDTFKFRNDFTDQEKSRLEGFGYSDEELEYLQNNNSIVTSVLNLETPILTYIFHNQKKGDMSYGISSRYVTKTSSFCAGHPLTRIFKNLEIKQEELF